MLIRNSHVRILRAWVLALGKGIEHLGLSKFFTTFSSMWQFCI